jgi:fumarate reductase subunit D
MAGYHWLGGLGWMDSFLNAAMILSGMGPVDALQNDAVKIFAGLYAIYSGLLIVATTALILAPALHRLLHRLHVKDEQDPDDDDDDDPPASGSLR